MIKLRFAPTFKVSCTSQIFLRYILTSKVWSLLEITYPLTVSDSLTRKVPEATLALDRSSSASVREIFPRYQLPKGKIS